MRSCVEGARWWKDTISWISTEDNDTMIWYDEWRRWRQRLRWHQHQRRWRRRQRRRRLRLRLLFWLLWRLWLWRGLWHKTNDDDDRRWRRWRRQHKPRRITRRLHMRRRRWNHDDEDEKDDNNKRQDDDDDNNDAKKWMGRKGCWLRRESITIRFEALENKSQQSTFERKMFTSPNYPGQNHWMRLATN